MRASYFEGHHDEARTAIGCLKREHPKDADVLRFSSDIDWWEGRVDSSQEAAREALALDPWTTNPELAIHLTERAEPFHLNITGEGVWGEGRSTSEFSGLLDYRLPDRDHVSVGFSRFARTFPDSTTLTDRTYQLGYVRVQGERTYIESVASYSSDHQFSPEFTIGVEPHYVFTDDSDVSLLLKYLHYVSGNTSEEVGMLAPGWRKVFGDWSVGATVNLLITESSLLPSVQGTLSNRFLPKMEGTLLASGGRALEAPALPDDFYSFGAKLSRYLLPEIALTLQGSIYRAALYSENRVGLGADWFF